MANNLIPEELNALIKEYLTDGVLTDKERQVILNKAEKMGLDRDEIDLYLDAQVQKIDQQTDTVMRRAKGKTCPYCGAPIPQLADKCPACGQFITPEASDELREIIDNLEEAFVDFKLGKDIKKNKAAVERFIRKAKMYYGNNPKIQKLLEEVEIESLKTEKVAKANARKKTIVKMLTYNWKITAIVCFLLIGFIWWGVSAVVSAIKGPNPYDPGFLIEYVNQTLASGDIGEAEVACATYMEKLLADGGDFSIAEVEGALDLIIQYESSVLEKFIKEGDLVSADEFLSNVTLLSTLNTYGQSEFINKYEPLFFRVINAHLQKGDLDSAESLALVWRSRIEDEISWAESSCYKALKAKFKAARKDFSALKSEHEDANDAKGTDSESKK